MELKPGKYRHFKGNEYELIGTASHSETLEPMVSTVPFTASRDCGSGPLLCGQSMWNGPITAVPGSSTQDQWTNNRI